MHIWLKQMIWRQTENAVHPLSTATESPEPSYRWIRDLPKTDISDKIRFSFTRCLLSIISLVLVVTDVPRTGLGIKSISDFFPDKVAPDTAVLFGPYAYPVVHIACTDLEESLSQRSCSGSSAQTNVSSVPVWPYAFDTTSIGIRSVADLLNLSPQFPDFLLNRGNDPRRGNPHAKMRLNEAFAMLESVIESSELYLRDQNDQSILPGISIATRYMYVDRLSDYLLQWFRSRKRTRKFLLQMYTTLAQSPGEMLKICQRLIKSNRRHVGRASLCDHPVRWMLPHPIESLHLPVAIWDHVALRFNALQEQHHGLKLDVTLLSTQELVSIFSLTRAAIYNVESDDLVVLTRGQLCNDEAACKTVFVDDYRYERYLITTNVADLYRVTSTLRGTAQFYVWTRLLLLLYTCYVAQPPTRNKLAMIKGTIITIFKIPFQVVVYGSYIPVTLYMIALLVDGNFVDEYLEAYWASVGGSINTFNLIGFIRVASVQMRNVWVMAFLAKISVVLQTRGSRWRTKNGLYGIRGLAISFASFLSIFGPYRSLSFRNCDVVTTRFIGDLDRSHTEQVRLESSPVQNVLIVGNSMVTTLGVITLLLIVSSIVHVLGRKRLGAGVLFAPSSIIPYAAGNLWPLAALAIRFSANVKAVEAQAKPTLSKEMMDLQSKFSPQSRGFIAVSSRQHWRDGITRSFSSINIRPQPCIRQARYSVEVQSLVKLMNITMMSDPWTFFTLFIVGRQLYVYRAQHIESELWGSASLVGIFAYNPAALLRETGLDERHYKLIDRIKSNNLPVAIVICCV